MAKKTTAAAEASKPVLVVKYCRGRLGGSAQLLAIIQRARWQGREVLVIDGDESSKTLRTYYPPETSGGALIPDGTDVVAFKDLMLAQMSAMVSDQKSRVVDISGGSRDMDEVMAELSISEFCEDYGIDLIAISMLGPDLEDFSHVIKAIDSGMLRPKDMLLVMNQGVIRGNNPNVAFAPLKTDARFSQLRADGARGIFMPRLPVMAAMRDALADIYEVASGKKSDGSMHDPIWAHMSKRWLADMEDQYVKAGVAEILP